jgi:RNA 3'-terminal phosphate cyclase (GTP)
MHLIDGRQHEGGGQILRTSLALSLRTLQPFRIENIRAGRSKPGLQAQHLAAVRLARSLGQAEVEGDQLGSLELTFKPGRHQGGYHKVDVGTAGAVTLLLQACLWALPLFDEAVTLDLRGGTDVNWAPPLDYLCNVTLPALEHFIQLEVEVIKRGFFPKGGGRILVHFDPAKLPQHLAPINLVETVPEHSISIQAWATPDLEQRRVSQRLLDSFQAAWQRDCPIGRACCGEAVAPGSGAVLVAWSDNQVVPIGIGVLGQKGVAAETLGQQAAQALSELLSRPEPVDEHLADQLVPYLGIAGGQMRAQSITPHTLANCAVTSQFLGCKFHIDGSLIRTV